MRHTLILYCIFLPLLLAQTKRGVTPEDYYRFLNVSDPHLSPNGKQVAYVVTQVDEKHGGRASSVWLVDSDGSQPPRRFASSASSPRWRPDGGALAFLSARQIHVAPMNGGEPQKLTPLANGVTAFNWSPDGKQVALVSRSGPKYSPGDTRHYLHSSYKFNGRGYFDPLRTHIWVLNVASGEVRQVTSGDQRNDKEPAWSPDGTKIAFSAEHTDRQCCAAGAVYGVPAAGGDLKLVAEKLSSAQAPRWSPDGQRLVFIGDPDGGMAKISLPNAPDLAPIDLAWSADGQALFFTANTKGEEHLFSWRPASNQLKAITSGARAVRAVDRHEPAGLMVYTATSTASLEDLFVARLDGTGEK